MRGETCLRAITSRLSTCSMVSEGAFCSSFFIYRDFNFPTFRGRLLAGFKTFSQSVECFRAHRLSLIKRCKLHQNTMILSSRTMTRVRFSSRPICQKTVRRIEKRRVEFVSQIEQRIRRAYPRGAATLSFATIK